MNVLFILIGVSILIAVFFLGIFIYSVKNGQYDDTYSPAHRILFDEAKKSKSNDAKSSNIDNSKNQIKR